ncbi:MAG: hypothetical protein ACYS9C_11645 [Planctomycetota bacterium]
MTPSGKSRSMKLASSRFLSVRLAWPVLAGILLLMGCDSKPRSGSNWSRWSSTGVPDPVHGIDTGSAYFGRYQKGTAIIVWVDVLHCTLKIKPTWDKTTDCVKYAGYVESVSRRRVDVECYVEEPMKGSATIGGQKYDLANGSLFLISVRSPQTRVAQIKQDIYTVTPRARNRKQLVEDAPEIRAFFEGPAEE